MKEKFMHIIPSGAKKTLCGLRKSRTIKGSDLQLAGDCKKCLKIGEKLIEEERANTQTK